MKGTRGWVVFAGLVVAAGAGAAVSSVSGDARIDQQWPDQVDWWTIDTNPGGTPNPNDNELVVFDELSCVAVDKVAYVDQEVGESGARVGCTFTAVHGPEIVHDFPLGIVNVDGAIVGLVTSRQNLEIWDEICGRPNVDYPTNLVGRGLEMGDQVGVSSAFEVEFSWFTGQDPDADHVRIVHNCMYPVADTWTSNNNTKLILGQSTPSTVTGDICVNGTCTSVISGSYAEPTLTLDYEVSGVLYTIEADLSADGTTLLGDVSKGGTSVGPIELFR